MSPLDASSREQQVRVPLAHAAGGAVRKSRVRQPNEGWVLVETMAGAGSTVIVEDGRIRQFARTGRMRIAGSATIASQLDEVLNEVLGSGHTVRRTVRLTSGLKLRIVGVPVIGPFTQVYAVQLWVGRVDAKEPPRLPVGILAFNPQSGIAYGCEISSNTEEPEIIGTSALPRLLNQLDGCDNRAGLLELMSAPVGSRWIGTATSAGPVRRHLCIAARSCASPWGPVVRVIVCDITEVHPPTPASLDIGVLRSMPVPPDHAAGLVDLQSGLVHEWIALGPSPLDRWMTEVPQTHPEDVAEVQRCRTALIDGARSEKCSFRVRFDDRAPWVLLRAHWTAVPCDGARQALLDITQHKSE